MIKILNCNKKNYLNNLVNFLDKRRSKKNDQSKIIVKIVKDVKKNKFKALIKYEKKFSKNKDIKPSLRKINLAIKSLDPKIKKSINFAYKRIYNFHLNGGYDLTLVASAKEYKIPYGTCELNKNGDLLRINERPQHDYLINTGLYILNPEILDLIPKNKFFHITQLIEKIMTKNSKVGVYPVNDNAWIDVGQWNEYKKAREKLL